MDGLRLPWKFMVDLVGPTFCRSASHGLSRKTSKNRTSKRSVASTLKPQTQQLNHDPSWEKLALNKTKIRIDSSHLNQHLQKPSMYHVPSIYKTPISLCHLTRREPRSLGPWQGEISPIHLHERHIQRPPGLGSFPDRRRVHPTSAWWFFHQPITHPEKHMRATVQNGWIIFPNGSQWTCQQMFEKEPPPTSR